MSKAEPSKVEIAKASSDGLRGALAADLAQPTPGFGGDGPTLLKFHGVYQGYDRDTATGRKQQGLGKEVRFMARVRIPGGRLTAAQYLALDTLADEVADGTLRITTRQAIQYHGVLKAGLQPLMQRLDHVSLTTLAACGDVVRNVITVPAPIRDGVHRRLEADAHALSGHLLPRTRGYHEVWIDGEKVAGDDEDALYGQTYLPRKFKIGVAIPGDNTIDVLTNDLGIVALFEGETLLGYNFALGGGLGMTHNNPKTYPRLATPVAFIQPDDLLEAAAAVVKLHRDFGDRSNRKHARLKYVIAEKGEEWARRELERYLGKSMAPARPMPEFKIVDHLGWHEQGDGRLYLGIPVPSGRVGGALRLALREAVERFGTDPILLPSQDILLSNIARGDRPELHALLRGHGVVLAQDITPIRRWALACPALPTCALALTEAERVREPLVDAIEERLKGLGLSGERMSLRITGCPNGCARPYSGDIGIVGRMPGHYAIYVGGDFEGTRLSFPLVDRVAYDKVADTLETLFALFARERREREGFGDFCHRLGPDFLLEALGVPARKAS